MAKLKDLTLAEKIGCNIKKFRQKKHPGHGGARKCAVEFGVTPQAWSEWEKAVKTPGDANQRKLSDYFGISVAELRGETSPPSAAGEDVELDVLNAIFQLQESLASFGRHLVSGKSVDDFADVDALLEIVRRLEEQLSELQDDSEDQIQYA